MITVGFHRRGGRDASSTARRKHNDEDDQTEDAEPRKNPHGVDARALHDSEHALVSHITLQPGEALKRHITPVDVVFYVVEGTGVVEVGDEKQEVGPDEGPPAPTEGAAAPAVEDERHHSRAAALTAASD